MKVLYNNRLFKFQITKAYGHKLIYIYLVPKQGVAKKYTLSNQIYRKNHPLQTIKFDSGYLVPIMTYR